MSGTAREAANKVAEAALEAANAADAAYKAALDAADAAAIKEGESDE